MYINLDVVMRLVQIGLVVAGIGALITLAMLFKNLIHTLSALTGALDLLQRDLAKLEGPLDTVDQLSSTVNEIQSSAKRAANTAIDTFQSSSQHFMKWVDSKTAINEKKNEEKFAKESADAPKTEAQKPEEKPAASSEASHFVPIPKKEESEKPETASEKSAEVEISADHKTISVTPASQESEKPAEPASEIPAAEVEEVIVEENDD